MLYELYAVQATMCSKNQAHLQYKQVCAATSNAYHRTNEDVQYEQGTSSVQTRMCSTNQAHRQYEQGCAVPLRNLFQNILKWGWEKQKLFVGGGGGGI